MVAPKKAPAAPKKCLRGAVEISDYTGIPLPQTRYLLTKGELPAHKRGHIWLMRPEAYERDCEQREAAARGRR